jgi:hypothetical protein
MSSLLYGIIKDQLQDVIGRKRSKLQCRYLKSWKILQIGGQGPS